METETDAFLHYLVQLANYEGFSCRLTLRVGNTLVRGELIGQDEYARGVGELLQVEGDLEQGLHSLAAALTKEPQNFPYPADRITDEQRHNPGGYLHLREVSFATPGGEFKYGGELWRVRTDAVEGFALHGEGGGTFVLGG
ncbi:MAG: hypothetical protein M3220_19680 [Chloroflexota bacterium]|nr:hypothetical protein [Chloroflexota bacterium]